MNIRSYPTTIFYNQSVPHQFHGDRSANALVEFVKVSQESSVGVTRSDCTYTQNTMTNWYRHTNRQKNRQTDRQTDRQADRQTGGQTDRQTDRQAGRQTDGQTDRQTDRHKDRQTDTKTDTKTDRQYLEILSKVRLWLCH